MPQGPILLAVDFSPASHQALLATRQLAQDLGVGVVLAHVLPEHSMDRPKADEKASLEATQWAEELRSHGLDVDVVVRASAAPEIMLLDEAEKRGCSMVAIGAQGRSSLQRWLTGSVARGLIQRSRLPVLTIPPRLGLLGRPLLGAAPAVAPSSPAARCILVAVDFSSPSQAAYQAALRLATDLRAAVRLVHVVDIPFTTPGYPYSESMLSPEMLARDEEQAAEGLASMASQGRQVKVGVTPEVHVGHPASAILAAARGCGATLIVVGTHGRSALQRFFLGSVAQSLVQMADRPVLVVPDRLAAASGEWTH